MRTLRGKAHLAILEKYKFVESGLDNIFLLQVPVIRCESCSLEDVLIPNSKEIERNIARVVANQPSKLSGKEVRFLRKYIELSINDLADVLSVRRGTISRWENGADLIGDTPERLLRCLAVESSASRQAIINSLRAITSNRAIPEIDTNTTTHEYAYV